MLNCEDSPQEMYREEVGKLVDGLVEDIRNGHLTTPMDSLTQLAAACKESKYLADRAHCVEVVSYAEMEQKHRDSLTQLALSMMFLEAMFKLRLRPEFKALKHPEDK